MNAYDWSITPVPTWSLHSAPRSLFVAVLLAITPFLAVVALTYPALAAAFVAGVVAAGALAAAPAIVSRLARPVRQSGRPSR